MNRERCHLWGGMGRKNPTINTRGKIRVKNKTRENGCLGGQEKPVRGCGLQPRIMEQTELRVDKCGTGFS